MKKQHFAVSVTLCTLFFSATTSHAARLFISSYFGHEIHELDTASKTSTYLTTIDGNLSDFAYDPVNDSVFWTVSSGYGQVGHYNPHTGSNQTLLDGTALINPSHDYARIHDASVDMKNGYIYFSDIYNSGIYRSNLDGTGIETLIAPDHRPWGPQGLEIDPVNNSLFWYDNGYIHRSDLDGSCQQELIATTCAELAIDHTDNKLYWSDNGTIMRADLDGSNIQSVLYTGLATTALVVDPNEDKIFYAGYVMSDNHHYVLRSCDLDGSDEETLMDHGIDNRTEYQIGAMCLAPEPTTAAMMILGVTLASRKRRM